MKVREWIGFSFIGLAWILGFALFFGNLFVENPLNQAELLKEFWHFYILIITFVVIGYKAITGSQESEQ